MNISNALIGSALRGLGFEGEFSAANVAVYAQADSDGLHVGYEVKVGSTLYLIKVIRGGVYAYKIVRGMQVIEMSLGNLEQSTFDLASSVPLVRSKLTTPSTQSTNIPDTNRFRSLLFKSVVALTKIAHPGMADEVDGYWEEIKNKGFLSQVQTVVKLIFSIAIKWAAILLVITGIIEKLAHWFRSA